MPPQVESAWLDGGPVTAGVKPRRKASKPRRPAKPAGLTSLTLRLNDPGMTPLHRAGLGGLATTLRAMERRHRQGRLAAHELPGGNTRS